MGTILTSYGDAGYQHEGYAAQVLDDGSTTSSYSDQTRARMVGQVIAACGCGWTGSTRYPTTGPFDEDAEALALDEWEHDHALPVLERDQLAKWDQLRNLLHVLGTKHRDRLTDNATRGLTANQRLELLDRTLRALTNATELARELRDHTAADTEGGDHT